MNRTVRIVTLVVVLCAINVQAARAARISKEEVDQQNRAFKQYFETDVVWKFDDLPIKAIVPKHRIPWAGYIYPDRGGGTAHVMQKYDRAFNRGRSSASSWERMDIKSRKDRGEGLFGRGLFAARVVPRWAGHCNGWTAAAIRHVEPEKNVVRNGVVFTPSDIKGLLAELYVYSNTDWLAGADDLDRTRKQGVHGRVVRRRWWHQHLWCIQAVRLVMGDDA